MSSQPSRTEPEWLFRGYSGRIFIIIAIATLVVNLGRQAIPPLLPAIIDDLSISAAAAGFALTLMRISFAVCQYPSGRISDVVSRRAAIVGGLLGIVVGVVFLTQVWTYAILLLGAIFLGIGSAFFFVSERVLLSDLFVAKRGLAFGVNSAVSRIGSIVAAGLAVVALSWGSWQLAFVPVAILLVVLTIVYHASSREPYGQFTPPQFRTAASTARETITRVFNTRETRWLVVAYTLVIFTWEGTLGFLPTFLQESKGFSVALASGGFASLFAVGIIVQPIAGTLSDRWSRRLVAGGATLLSGVGLTLLVIGSGSVEVTIGIVVYAMGFMAFSPVVQAYLMDVFPDGNKGGDLGAFKTVYEGLSSIGPTYVGVVAGFSSYTAAFSGFLICLVLSAGILLWLGMFDS